MGYIELLIVIAVIGVIAWALQRLPMPGLMKTLITVAAVLICAVLLLRALGVGGLGF